MRTKNAFPVCMALIAAGCFKAPGRGPALADGCYYAGATPVLKIDGNEGQALIDGEVRAFAVERRQGKHVSQAIFSPGFQLLSGPPLRTELSPKFSRSHYMMAPGEVPTIMMFADKGGISLRLGPLC